MSDWQQPTPEAIAEMKRNGTWSPNGDWLDRQPTRCCCSDLPIIDLPCHQCGRQASHDS